MTPEVRAVRDEKRRYALACELENWKPASPSKAGFLAGWHAMSRQADDEQAEWRATVHEHDAPMGPFMLVVQLPKRWAPKDAGPTVRIHVGETVTVRDLLGVRSSSCGTRPHPSGIPSDVTGVWPCSKAADHDGLHEADALRCDGARIRVAWLMCAPQDEEVRRG